MKSNLKIIKKVTVILLVIATIIAFGNVIFYDNSTKETIEAESDNTLVNTINNTDLKYSGFLDAHQTEIIHDYKKVLTIDEYADLTDISHNVISSEAYGYKNTVIKLETKDAYNFNINVEKAGLYEIYFDYYILANSIIETEASFLVNDTVQYYETKQMVFQSTWITETEEFAKDRYGNEILPTYVQDTKWHIATPAYDGSSLNAGAMLLKLEKGNNKLTITIKTGGILIGDITLSSKSELISYEEYLKSYEGVSKNKELTIYPAEIIASKSSLDMRLYSLQDKSCTRYDTRYKLLNAIYQESWDEGNQSITWNINVPETGLYNLSFKYIQNILVDLPVNRTILINGKVPYEDLYAYEFYYTKRWANESLHNSDGLLYVYLEKGDNTLTLSTNMDYYRGLIENVDRIMDEMSEMALDIKYLTNGQSDQYRNWKITDFIPELESELNRWADEIDELVKDINTHSKNKKGSSSLSNLKIASKKLRKLAKDPEQIANSLTVFTEGSSSVSQLLGNVILTFNTNPLGLEKIFTGGEDTKLPRTRSLFITKFFEGVKRFFISFFVKEYSVGESSDDELEIWVNRSRQYIEIMQQLADVSGQKVKFSIMPDQNKLILANASGSLPDVAMGVSNWIPYDLALRGISEDLRGYEGYEELISKFASGSLIPYAYEDGLYGIPETQDFYVTFYRSDILNSLDLDVPNTWEDLIADLPLYQRLDYNFYSPLSMYRGLKPYVATLPYFYQFGGVLYSSDGMETILGNEENINALKLMTDLFTIYNIPEETLSFYNSFRYGTLPIGIANASTYTQLLIAAPEIQGNWDIALHVGNESSDGEILRYSTAASQGITMFASSNKKEQAWDFISWWMSTETQSLYIQTLYSMYGLEYLWYTANLEAFETLPIDANHKEVMLEQLRNWSMEASRVPAAYMLERAISDAYSKIIYDGENVRIALDEATIESNREIKRKLEEFGYIKDNQKIKDYKVPTVYNISDWLTNSRKG